MSFWKRIFGVEEGERGIDLSIDGFVRHALKGPAYCRVKISQIGEIHDALTRGLMKERIPTSRIVGLVDAGLKGVCPECGTWYSGEWLSWFGTIQSPPLRRKPGIVMGSQSAQRALKSLCINPRCSCKEIVICWRVEDDPRGRGLSYDEAARVLGLSKGKDTHYPCPSCGALIPAEATFCPKCDKQIK